MTTINLHKYHDQINQFLEDSQYSLAASHCRYILQQYPRHVDTYRLLAKTLIEQGDYSGATELFQRVLCADPNDYIAHAGLSVVYREEDVLPQSIWHLERAYEIEPYNSAIQQELRDLYIDFSEQRVQRQQSDSAVDIPENLPLTKGALARLYIQGELYTQAIDVLREALAEDEDRIDLEVLLAEALWRDNQRIDAVRICLQVLEKLPNSITANAVMAEIWLQTGRTDEAQQYLNDLQALTLMDVDYQDLETPAGSAFQPEGAMVLPAVFEVERMGDELSSLVDGEALGAVAEDGMITAEESDEYQWLEDMGDDLIIDEEDASPEGPLSTVPDSDWLRRELEVSEEETAVAEDLSDWLDEEESGVGTLGVLATGAVAAGVIGEHLTDDADFEEPAAREDTDAETDMLDWLSQDDFEENVPEEDETIFAQVERAEEAEEIPDWLADMSGEDMEPVQINPLEAADYLKDDEEPDYLSGMDADDAEEDIYGWLEDAAGDEAVEEIESGTLDLSQFAEFGGGEEDEADDDEEVVWRLTDELNPPEEDSVEAEQDEVLDDFDFEISIDEMSELDDIPDWLMGSSGTDELEAASPTEVAGSEIADELAEWVAASQPDGIEDDDLSDWLSDETDLSDTPEPKPVIDQTIEPDDEDDFFTGDLPSWMIDSSVDIGDSGLLDSAPLFLEETEESSPLAEADLPDWLMGGNSMDMDDSGLLDTGTLPDESSDATTADPEMSEELPDWLMGDAPGFADEEEGETQESDDGSLLGWLSDEEDEEDETQPEPLVLDSSLEDEVMEDAVSDKQDDLIGPQDELETPETTPQEESDEFDWLDDLGGASLSAQEESLPMDDLGDDLDWMNLDDAGDSDELDLDALLGLETEEESQAADVVEGEAEPVVTGLAEDESLDWLDALAEDEPEAVDEMPTWQWPEDADTDPILGLDAASDTPEIVEPVAEDMDAIFSEEPAEADVAEDLDDAMSWLEDLAAEPDAPVEELPSVAEDMDLDALFATESELDGFDDLSSDGVQTETLDEIFAVDTQNDSWLEGLADADEEPMPDFLEEDAEFDVDGLFDEDAAETAVIPESTEALESVADVGEPPEDIDDAMAWLEQLAARQGAPLDELPSVDDVSEEEDGMGAAEVVAGAVALGALGAVLDDEPAEESEPVPEPVTAVEEALAEEDILAMSVPEDPDEAMAWLEKLAARQGAPLDELPSVSEDDEIPAIPTLAEEDDLFGLDADEAVVDDLLADIETIPGLTETEDDALGDLDEAMAWLDGLEDDDLIEPATEVVTDEEASAEFGELADFGDEELDFFGFEEDTEPVVVEEPVASWVDDLGDDLDWLETVAGVDADAPAYNAEELSVSDDDLTDALEKLTLLTVTGAAVGAVATADKDEPEAALDIPADEFIESMPEDPDEAMAWLEKLAARQGAPLDELPSVAQDEYDNLAAAGIAEAAVAETETFIQELEPVSELPVGESLEVEETAAAVSPEDMDMDDAMAWLEQLAARQGTSLDELPSVDDVPVTDNDVDTPDWIAKQTGPLDDSVLDSLDIPEVSDELLNTTPDEDFFAALDEVPVIEGLETGIAELDHVEFDDFMPDWLSEREESEGDDPLGHTGWLNALDEPDMDGWLAAEGEATMSSDVQIDAMPEAVDTDSLMGTGGLEDTGGLQDTGRKEGTGELRLAEDLSRSPVYTTELDEVQVLADLGLGDFGIGLDQAQLESARNALAGGEIDAALHNYQGLVETGESMHTVISDLERAAELHQDKPMVRRMLGDAYMRNGQINRAIETYRDALDQM